MQQDALTTDPESSEALLKVVLASSARRLHSLLSCLGVVDFSQRKNGVKSCQTSSTKEHSAAEEILACPHTMEDHQPQPSLKQLVRNLECSPQFEPSRYQSTDGFQDPVCPNGMWEGIARKALAIGPASEGKVEEAELDLDISDLICNLLHLAHSCGYDLAVILERSLRHFNAEAGNLLHQNSIH